MLLQLIGHCMICCNLGCPLVQALMCFMHYLLADKRKWDGTLRR